jgi:nucleoside-diphosphate-sugar epimerase
MISRRKAIIAAASLTVSATPMPTAAPRRLVLTGHLGNVGHRIAPALQADGWTLAGIDKKTGPQYDLGYWQESWVRAFAQARAIIHLAAHPAPNELEDLVRHNNIMATLNVLQAAREHRVPLVVFASSTWVGPGLYGNPEYPQSLPINWYGASKLIGEENGRHFAAQDGRTFVTVRIGWVPLPGTEPADPWGRRL